MGKFFDDEVITINAVTSVVFTAAKYDHNGGTRASRAVVQVGSTPIYLSFLTDPPTITSSIIGNTGDIIEITDFDNIRDAKIIAQSATGSLTIYVTYES